MKKKIKTEYDTNKLYFYFGSVISLLTIVPQLIFSPDQIHTLFLLLTFVLLVSIIKFSKILFAVFVIFINLSNILIGHIAIHWGYTIPEIRPRIEVAFLSPLYESKEYMANYVDYRDYLLIAFSFFVLLLLFKFMRHYTHSYRVFRGIGLGVFISILLSVSYFINPLRELEPFCVPNEVLSILDDKEKIDHLLNERKKFIAHMKIPVASQKHQLYDKIIIVMGESVNKQHMSLYGYGIKTTPFLDSLRKTHHFYVYDAIAPTNQTRLSLPIDLTDANVHDYEHQYLHSCSVITKFRANRYETYWISNQGRVGQHDSSISSMAYEAQNTYFANLNYLEAKTDQVLVEYLNKMQMNPAKEMYLIHIMGSHSDYINRYEPDQVLFKPAKNPVEEYDNTIYYTDLILRQIYERFKHQKLLLVYISDHGENINLENNGHGFLPPSKDEYMVPFVIYSTVKNRRLDELIRENQRGTFNLENFNHMVEYVSGLSHHTNVSFSRKVIAVEPKNIYDFDRLEMYN